jgi:hypothetical protein
MSSCDLGGCRKAELDAYGVEMYNTVDSMEMASSIAGVPVAIQTLFERTTGLKHGLSV